MAQRHYRDEFYTMSPEDSYTESLWLFDWAIAYKVYPDSFMAFDEGESPIDYVREYIEEVGEKTWEYIRTRRLADTGINLNLLLFEK